MAIDLGRTRLFLRDPQVEDGVNLQNKTTTEKQVDCWQVVIRGWYGLIRGFLGLVELTILKDLKDRWAIGALEHGDSTSYI